MPKLTFFPTGNADCCRIDLANGQKLLFDYADMRCEDDASDKRIDLEKALRADLESANRKHYDVVAFTHLDDDHICGSSEFFELTHDNKYQGGNRISMPEMWVPAFLVCEDPKECTEEAQAIQKEARHRLKQGKGIRVFSRPDALKAWMTKSGIDFEKVKHLITDAGQVVPGFNLATHGVEFFVHSPFATRHNDGTFTDRNTNSLVFQATFVVEGVTTKLMLAADSTHDVLTEIVKITRAKKREQRLEWDVFKLPHHCSYKSLSDDRGRDKTTPVPEVKWLFENQGQSGGTVVSTSWPIPSKDADDDDNCPPHRQAGNYQRDIATTRKGKFVVTMEHPSERSPEQLEITIDKLKATVVMRAIGAAYITSRAAPRAG
jgi:beta-lactamase superfamily II metal-dependent hydrolase